MRKLFLVLLVPFLLFSCESDNSKPRLLSFKLDGVEYRSSKPGALLTSNGNSTFDIQINTVESTYTFNLLIKDKPLQSAYIDVLFVIVSNNVTYSSQDCNPPISLSVTFEELNINTTRLNGTFSGKVCDGNTELAITDGILENIRLY